MKKTSTDLKVLQQLLWSTAGIERDAISMINGLKTIESGQAIEKLSSKKAINMYRATLTSHLILKSALSREESRGAHQRSDFPERDDLNWKRHQVVSYVK